MSYTTRRGDLITLAQEGEFDVIAHGCNCFCKMGAGIAPKMAEAFYVDKLPMELNRYVGDINKLGTIDYGAIPKTRSFQKTMDSFHYDILPSSLVEGMFKHYEMRDDKLLYVVNAYTQYKYGVNHLDGDRKPLDYEAITLCMRKINHLFSGKSIGLPMIGCGLAGGNWNEVEKIIRRELKNCDTTVVIFNN